MAVTSFDLDKLQRIKDPLKRYEAFLTALERTRELQAQLAVGRCLAVCELYVREGASEAARQLGISRSGLYKIIAEHAPDEVKQAMAAERQKERARLILAVATAVAATQLQPATRPSARTSTTKKTQ